MSRTRLAPSPTGALHLGNARTFLVNWALARQRGWEVVLRIEDLDSPRVKPAYVDQLLEDLRWLGIDWDVGPWTQRADLEPYQRALRNLTQRDLVYRCTCTRQQVEAATLSAPHADDHELRYPGTCRPPRGSPRVDTAFDPESPGAFRLRVPAEPIEFEDRFLGRQAFNLANSPGDFLVWTKQGLPSYQLAVVVDDHRQGVDQVIRGADLLSSVARQIWLYRCLELGPPPTYTHLPLVVGEDGRRLAKRHGDTRVASYRAAGVPPERLLGLLARWSGVDAESVTSERFAAEFLLEKMSKEQVVFRNEDDVWLRAGCA